MVWQVKDGNGGTTHTTDARKAIFDLFEDDGPIFDNALDAMLYNVSQPVIDALTQKREIAAVRDAGKDEAYNHVHGSLVATLDLIATDDWQTLRVDIDPGLAVTTLLQFAASLEKGISKGVVLDNEPSRRLIETLDSAASVLLQVQSGVTQPDENFDFDLAMSQISCTKLRETCSQVLEEANRWIESDSLVRSMLGTLL